MAIQILRRKNQAGNTQQIKKVDFSRFLSGIPARDYIFQDIPYEEQIRHSSELLKNADAVIIGAGAGLSTAAGLNYGGQRFSDNFQEFINRYGTAYMTDMYSAGFYPFPTQEEKWGYWSRHAYLNLNEAVVPESFGERAVGINADLAGSIEDILKILSESGRERVENDA